MLRYTFVLLLLCSGLSTVSSQTTREEILANPNISGSNYLAYPAPKASLTKAPGGKKPFYISHYGRHGSRYMVHEGDYTRVYDILAKADSAHLLTSLGRDVMQRINLMMQESHNRWGELTALGAQQHRDIARRMFERFPEVFRGSVHIDARSTTVIRCILSMENALQELARLNPQLQITHDASTHDLWYMKFKSDSLRALQYSGGAREFRSNWEQTHLRPQLLLQKLFLDDSLQGSLTDQIEFYHNMFELAGIVQNSEIRHTLTLYDLFSPDELYTLWQNYNMGWFIEFGPCSLNGATQPTSQRNLLHKMIAEADSCLLLDKPGATLRYGHDTNVLPLVCLMNINGYGTVRHPSELESTNWLNYRIFPMACNLQLVFYRKNKADSDVWVKVLLNEEEATLPLHEVSPGFYKWTEIKKLYEVE